MSDLIDAEVREVAEDVMPGAVWRQVEKFGELGRLHRPVSQTFTWGMGLSSEDACHDCLGGIFAVDPEEPRACGCWGLLRPICESCADRYENGKWARSAWPCPTWRALVAEGSPDE